MHSAQLVQNYTCGCFGKLFLLKRRVWCFFNHILKEIAWRVHNSCSYFERILTWNIFFACLFGDENIIAFSFCVYFENRLPFLIRCYFERGETTWRDL